MPGTLAVLRGAGRPLRLEEITAALGPIAAAEAPAQLEALVAKLRDMIPELLELNDSDLPAEVPFELLARRIGVSIARA